MAASSPVCWRLPARTAWTAITTRAPTSSSARPTSRPCCGSNMQAMLATISGPADDERLIHEAAGGDRAAFGELYLRHARMVHAILLARVPPADAEDPAHDAFMAALERPGGPGPDR